MSRWGDVFKAIGNAVVSFFSTGNPWVAAYVFASTYEASRRASRAREAAKRAYNDSLRDRLEMVDLQPDAARTLVLGRARTVEGVRRRWTTGANDEKLTLIVSYAGHQIDGYEQWYVDDTPVTIDANGWVQTSPWAQARIETRSIQVATDAAGNATFTLTESPRAGGSLLAVSSIGVGEGYDARSLFVVPVSGLTFAASGGHANSFANVSYEVDAVTSYMRIRPYLGDAVQNVGANLAAEYPGKISGTDRFAGIALAVVDLTYNQDVFPNGVPRITALLRGARVYDPRTATTAWSDNPALLAAAYATHELGMGLTWSQLRSADVSAAADACAVATSFTLRKPDNSTSVVTLPRYRAGTVIPSDGDRRTAMDSVVAAMAGEWGWAGGVIRMRAGAVGSSVATIDGSWLVQDRSGGEVTDEPVVSASNAVPREQRVNRVLGKCYDDAQRWQLLPYPAITDSVLVSTKGERRAQIDYEAVNHVAHAQHLASIAIRRAQAGMVVQLVCGPQADVLELFDVVTLNLPDWGINGKLYEVVGWSLAGERATRLRLREISSAIYSVASELAGRDPAPDSSLRPIWDIGAPAKPTVTSGTVATDDGAIVSRITVTWTAAPYDSVRQGGEVEVQYVRADQPLPSGEWASWVEPGSATQAIIPGLLAGRTYLVRVRYVQKLPLVRSPWSPLTTVAVASRRVPIAFRQADPPTGTNVVNGDEWYETDNGNRYYLRVAGVWVPIDVGTGGLQPGSATEVVEFYDASGIGFSNMN